MYGQALRHDSLAGRSLEHAAPASERPLVELGKAPELVRAKAEVHHPEGLFDLLRHVRLLDHAAADRNDEPRISRLGVHERADVAQNAHLRVAAYRTSVHDNELGLVLVLRKAEAHELDITAQRFAVRLVLLAAVGIHKGQRARSAQALAYLIAYLPLTCQLRLGDLYSFVCHIASKV